MKKTIFIIFIIAFLAIFIAGCTTNADMGNFVANVDGDDDNADLNNADIDKLNSDKYIKIPLSEISNTASFYSETINGVEVKFFAVLASDGSVKTAFDACDVCYNAKKGYTQEGQSMKCNNCGLQFKIDELGINNKGSGCWPSYLENTSVGDYIIISKEKLEAKTFMFA